MSRRSSVTSGFNPLLLENISNNIDSVIYVSESMDMIKQLLDMDNLEGLLETVRETMDFTGITVVDGSPASWDGVTKVLTVPTLKGDKGDSLRMTRVLQNPDYTVTWIFSDGTTFVTPYLKGEQGCRGERGERGEGITVTSIEEVGEGIYRWVFSDGTFFTTSSLMGPKGDDGKQGIQGIQGVRGRDGNSIHHLKGTSTTEPNGVMGTFGELDTYSFYGDADEKNLLGWFSVRNGMSGDEDLGSLGIMTKNTYDYDNDGIVDNTKRLDGKLISELGVILTFDNITDAQEAGNGVDEGSWVFIKDNGRSKWELHRIAQKEPGFISEIILTEGLYEDVAIIKDKIDNPVPLKFDVSYAPVINEADIQSSDFVLLYKGSDPFKASIETLRKVFKGDGTNKVTKVLLDNYNQPITIGDYTYVYIEEQVFSGTP